MQFARRLARAHGGQAAAAALLRLVLALVLVVALVLAVLVAAGADLGVWQVRESRALSIALMAAA